MILLDATDLSLSFSGKSLFSDLSVTVNSGNRLGVVGINGTGKSTLLRVLSGSVEADSGNIRVADSIRVSMLDQQASLRPGTVIDAATADGGELWEAEAALQRLGMGEHHDRQIDSLSGGEAKRVALARALTQPSDLLILDEPTNHLDLDSIEWLEQKLNEQRGAIILVTHDRHLLDATTTHMLELDRGKNFFHKGNYSSYLEAVEKREADAASAESVRKNLAKTELAWLRRGAKARSAKPKARIDQAKALLNAKPEGVARPSQLHLEFPTPRLGDVVIELHNVAVTIPDGRELFSNLDLRLDQRERLAIVGPNGAGKTSLLNVIAQKVQPTKGKVKVGTTVELSYYDQHSAELDPSGRVREIVAGPHREPDWTDARLLEAFWFDAQAQWAQVSTLSGGEKRRLHLMQILAERPNVLLLDEPTNDLDLETLRSLEAFLQDWPGALIVVSHDRAFLQRVTADALVVDGQGNAKRWPGGFDAWNEHRKSTQNQNGSLDRKTKQKKAAKQPKPSTGTTKNGADTSANTDPKSKQKSKSKSTLGFELRDLEKRIATLEKRKAKLETELVDAGTDHKLIAEAGAGIAVASNELQTAEEQWLALAEERQA